MLVEALILIFCCPIYAFLANLYARDTCVRAPVSMAKRGDDDYLPGNILEIELHNFMTYSYIKSRPGPRLNLVIGPNGTGKSSLVCAIAIGLAGEPQLLGRASSIGDYVKRGEESGWIKISLRGNSPAEIVTITRRINKQNKSDWFLNGRSVSKKEILDVVHGFNIQVNNLTQFLPQDRVCEFAKMTPIQLLQETEKAIGNPELSDQHQFLIQKYEDLKRLEVTVRQHEATLQELKAFNAEREKDVERVRQRNQLLKKAESMKKKLPWLVFDQKKNCLKEVKEKEKEAKQKLQDFAKQICELMAPLDEKKKIKAKLDAECKKLHNEREKIDLKKKEITEKENQMSVKVKSKFAEIEELHAHEARRQERVQKAREEVILAENELANLQDFEPPREIVEKLVGQIHELEMAASDKKNQRQEKESLQGRMKRTREQCVNRLKEFESLSTQRLQALKDAGARNIFEEYAWLQSHRNEFRKDVYGPVLLEVNIANKDHAAYVEGHVPAYMWKAFITQDELDRDLLCRNTKLPVLNFTGEFRTSRGAPLTPEMRELGIQMRLDEAFSAPPVVKEVLISQSMLDSSFIGSNETNHRADEANRLGIIDLWTPENHFHWQASRYGGHVSASVNPVRPARLFSQSVDAREYNEMQQRAKEAEESIGDLEKEIKSLLIEQRQLEDEAAEFHRQREEIVNTMKMERKRRQDLASRIEQRKRKLESIQKEEDAESAAKRLHEQIHEINQERLKKSVDLKDLLGQVVDKQKTYTVKHLVSVEVDLKVRELERSLRGYENQGTRAQQEFDHCKREVEKVRREVEVAKEAAERVARLTRELQDEFAQMPDTVECLKEAIVETEAEANAVLCLNDNVLEEYEARRQQIARLSAKLEDETADLERCQNEVDNVKKIWLPTLKGLISKINDTFSRNFREMAVAGEVTLDEHGNDFIKYGILIKVKFRETGELQVLSAHHQSGGERSVSTILYLVSLQDLTHCPFRVVDEINQGMDPINERKMFQQLVRAASEPNTPQCFLLTPKLLPDLEYTEACTILNIMNGPWIADPAKAWSSGSSWSIVMETLSQASQASTQMLPSQ